MRYLVFFLTLLFIAMRSNAQPCVGVPALTVTPSSSICNGNTVTLCATGGIGNYSWSPTNGLQCNTCSCVEVVTGGNPVCFTVTGTLANGCTTTGVSCVQSNTVGGSVFPVSSVVCSGGSKLFSLIGAVGNIQWETASSPLGPWTDVAGATSNTFNLTGITSSTYVRAILLSTSCAASASTTAFVNVSSTPLVTFTNVTATSATVSWFPSGTMQFNVSWVGAGGVTGTQTGATNPFTIVGLYSPCGGSLSVTVTQTSPVCSGTLPTNATVQIPCSSPLTLNVVSPGPSSFKATWTIAGPCAGQYRIYYKQAGTFNWLFADTSGTTKTITGLIPGNYSVYVVKKNCPTVGLFGSPTLTQCVSVGTLSCSPIPTVAALSNCNNALQINLSTNPAGNYQIRLRKIAPSLGSQITLNTTATVTNLSLSGVPNSTYEVTARRVCSGGTYSAWSCPLNVTVNGACAAPQGVMISNIDCPGFDITWIPSSCNISSYRIAIKYASSSFYTFYNVGLVNQYTFNWLTPNVYYNVYIQGLTSCGTLTQASSVMTVYTDGPSCRNGLVDDEPEDRSDLRVYPNPATSEIFLALPSACNNDLVELECINTVGQHIACDITKTASNKYKISLSNITNGLYWIRVKTLSQNWVKQIVVMH